MAKQSYITIAVDVKESSKQEMVSKKLNEIAEMLNEKLQLINAEYCLIPFTVRRGDEIMVVISSFSKGYQAYFELYNLLNNYVFEDKKKLSAYIGIGLGFIDDETEKDLHKINGSSITSAFRARDSYLKKNKFYSRQYNKYNKNITSFAYSLDDIVPYEAVNHLITYINENYEKRTEKQKKVVSMIDENSELTSTEIAGKLGSSENSIYKIIQRSNFQIVKDAQDSLKKLLDFIQKHYHQGGEND